MRKRRKWYGLKTLVPALVILPPLGLYLLWASPRSRWAKAAITIAVLLLFGSLHVTFVKYGIYREWIEPPVPESGFAVTRDSRGQYEIQRILPFERKVFNEVVVEIKRASKDTSWTSLQGSSIYAADPESRAFGTVARRYSLDPADVELIYMKVSSQLSRRR